MTEHLIGLSQDHLAPIRSRIEQRMLEKGVRLVAHGTHVNELDPRIMMFMGIGNRYYSHCELPALTEQPSPEQADQMVADMVLSVEQGLLQRRTEIEE